MEMEIAIKVRIRVMIFSKFKYDIFQNIWTWSSGLPDTEVNFPHWEIKKAF